MVVFVEVQDALGQVVDGDDGGVLELFVPPVVAALDGFGGEAPEVDGVPERGIVAAFEDFRPDGVGFGLDLGGLGFGGSLLVVELALAVGDGDGLGFLGGGGGRDALGELAVAFAVDAAEDDAGRVGAEGDIAGGRVRAIEDAQAGAVGGAAAGVFGADHGLIPIVQFGVEAIGGERVAVAEGDVTGGEDLLGFGDLALAFLGGGELAGFIADGFGQLFDGVAVLDGAGGGFAHALRVGVQGEQFAAVALGELAIHDHLLHVVGELEEAHQVGGGAA